MLPRRSRLNPLCEPHVSLREMRGLIRRDTNAAEERVAGAAQVGPKVDRSVALNILQAVGVEPHAIGQVGGRVQDITAVRDAVEGYREHAARNRDSGSFAYRYEYARFSCIARTHIADTDLG